MPHLRALSRYSCVIAVTAAFLSINAQAEVVWREKVISLTAKPGDASVRTTYSFKNTGNMPVKITSVTPSCSCTVAQLQKKVIAPGENGEIEVIFDVGGRTGPQSKTIEVVTFDERSVTTTLQLKIDIPELVIVTPRLLFWDRNSAATAREIVLSAGTDVAFNLIAVQCDDPQIKVENITETVGSRYRVRVTPITTKSKLEASIRLQIEATIGHPEFITVFAYIP